MRCKVHLGENYLCFVTNFSLYLTFYSDNVQNNISIILFFEKGYLINSEDFNYLYYYKNALFVSLN